MKHRVDNAIILAAGMSTRFVPMSLDIPKGLVKVRNEVLIERLIKQLLAANINEIIVVTGYKASSFDYLQEKFNVKCVYNPEFESRNNHASLYVVQDYLKNSYICSSDNYYMENVFNEVEDCAYYSTLFADGVTDEWCVKADEEGFIDRVTIGGEKCDYMMGHAYFDEAFSRKFVNILNDRYHSIEIRNMLWEHLYAEHLDVLKLKIKRHQDNQIVEFDSLKELKAFDPWYQDHTHSKTLKTICSKLKTDVSHVKKICPLYSGNKLTGFSFRVKKKKYQYIVEQNLLFDASKLIDGDNISSIKSTIENELNENKPVKIKGIYKLGGLTNYNYLVYYDQKKVVFRTPGAGSNKLINRYDEALNMEAAKHAGVDAEVLFFEPELGIKITEYIENSQTLSNEDFSKKKIIVRVAELLNHLHTCDIDMAVDFNVRGKIEYYEQLICQMDEIPFKDYLETKQIVLKLLDSVSLERSFCHNDPLAENFILAKDKLTLIDWEYAGMNHPYWDVAAVSVEVRFTEEQEQQFLNAYFEKGLTNEKWQQVKIQKVLVDFLWSLWGLYFTYQGKDYYQYALDRYENCLKSIGAIG